MAGSILTEPTYEKGNQSYLKRINTLKVLNLLRERESLPRVELAALCNLDKKTITNIVNELLAEGQIIPVSKATGGAGRPREMLAINGDYCRCIGIDLGGTHISGVILNFEGRVLCSYNVDLNNDMEFEMLMKLCQHTIDSLLAKAQMTMEDIIGIGIAVPGFVDKETGQSILAENLPRWENIPIRQVFQERYNIAVHVDDCSRLMALAELWYGHERGCDNFLVMDLGLGIGCGIVIDGKIYAGATGKSGEIGHTIVKIDGPPCTCGRRGCIESLASGWALAREARAIMNAKPDSLLHSIINNEVALPSTKDVLIAASLGDEDCIRMLEEAGEYVGIGIANAISFYNPSTVYIGGRLHQDNPIMMGKIEETVKKQTIPYVYTDTKLISSEIGNFASAIGAATLCLEPLYTS